MRNNFHSPMYDVVIVGCGPAGLMAAVYTGRAQLKTIVFGDYRKGNLYKSHIIANYFGFPEPITGPELTMKGVEHAKKFGAEIVEKEIVDIRLNDDGTFILKNDAQEEYQSKTVIIATGQSYALSGIKNEQELTGKGVSYCVICDGFFFKNKNVVVIGNGNYAAEEALQLLNYTKDITVLSHGKEFIFSELMQKELEEGKIKTIKTPRIKEIASKNDKVEKLRRLPEITSIDGCRDARLARREELPYREYGSSEATKPGGMDRHSDVEAISGSRLIFADGSEMETSGIFMAVGVAGATAFAKKLGLEMNNNYIKIDHDGATNIKGLYAAGDCTGSPPQVASSVGIGCNAALSAIKLIRGSKIYIDYN